MLVGLVQLVPALTFSGKVGLTAFTGVPLLLLAVIQIDRAIRLQRASFVKDYVSKFFIEKGLYENFHELIYTYSDKFFEQVDEALQEVDGQDNKSDKTIQNGDTVRRYHPKTFQGSSEERKLDVILG